jgi:hypothetical protein
MTTHCLWVGTHDISWVNAPRSTTANPNIDTTAGRFRSGYSPYAITFHNNNSNINFPDVLSQPFTGGATSSLWFAAQMWNQVQVTGSTNVYPLKFLDANGVVRLRLKCTNGVIVGSGMTIEKVTAAGVATTLGTFNGVLGFNNAPPQPDRIDVHVNYGTSGSIDFLH